MTAVLLALILVAGLCYGLPIGFALVGFAVIWVTFVAGIPATLVSHTMVTGLDSWSFLAIPFFVLMGEIMVASGITRRMVDFAISLISPVRGALAQASIISGIFLAGVSGSATADAAALGSTLIPAMKQKRYDAGFAAAIIGSAAIIGAILPPSIPLVVYGSLANVSIGRLFLAGIIPGLLMGLYLILATAIIVRRQQVAAGTPWDRTAVRRTFLSAAPSFAVPIVVILGLVFGIVTPTESAVIAVFVATLLGLLVYRQLTLRGIIHSSRETIILMGSVMVVVAASAVLGKIGALDGLGERVVGQMLEWSGGETWLLLLYLNIILLVLGIAIEPLPLIILLTPIIAGPFAAAGIDPVQLGIIVTFNLVLGMITPPVGTVMFIVMGIARVSMWQFTKAILPFFAALIVVLGMVTYIPQVTLWLPNLLLPVE